MSKYWILSLIAGICFILGSVLVITFTVRNRLDQETYQVKYEELRGGMEHSFTSKHNNLNIIILHFKNPGLENKDKFNFKIMDPERVTIVDQTFTGFNLGDPADLRFQFDQIPDSGSRNLILKLDSESSESSPISVGVDNAGKIAFSSYYRGVSKRKEFVEVINNLIIHVAKDTLFFGSLFILVVILFWKWRKIS